MFKTGRRKCLSSRLICLVPSPYWNLREWNLQIMLVLMQKLKGIWSFLLKRLQITHWLHKDWSGKDTGIQLHVKITKCAKRILNKGLIYYKGKPFTFDKDTHYMGCWVNRYFSWAKVLSVFQASIKIISIYRSSMCYLLLFLLLLLSLKRMLNSRTFITKFDILYLCSVTHKNQNINRCKKVLTSKNTFKQEHLPLHIEINT